MRLGRPTPQAYHRTLYSVVRIPRGIWRSVEKTAHWARYLAEFEDYGLIEKLK